LNIIIAEQISTLMVLKGSLVEIELFGLMTRTIKLSLQFIHLHVIKFLLFFYIVHTKGFMVG
jgi:hypothetical protein